MTAKFTIEVEIEVDYDFTPGAAPSMPAFGDPIGDPGYPEEIEITKIEAFAILEPRRDPLPAGGWSKTKWIASDMLPHILKWMPAKAFAELIVENDYVRELAEDAIREMESD